MAKSSRIQIKLESTENTGYFYISTKNVKNVTKKIELKKYDPVIKKHTIFRETKMK